MKEKEKAASTYFGSSQECFVQHHFFEKSEANQN
jgi:hypothetical protein